MSCKTCQPVDEATNLEGLDAYSLQSAAGAAVPNVATLPEPLPGHCKDCQPVLESSTEMYERYSLQDEVFPTVLDCPPGYDCSRPTRVRVVCCDGAILSATLPSSFTVAQREAILIGMTNECTRRLPSCIRTPPPIMGVVRYYFNDPVQVVNSNIPGHPCYYSIPAGTYLAGSREAANAAARGEAAVYVNSRCESVVSNELQTYTAHCVPEDLGAPKTGTVAAGTYKQTLVSPTLAQIQMVLGTLNAQALAEAQAQAEAQLTCGVCNVEIEGSASCPGEPWKSAHVIVPAGTFCEPVGTGQWVVDEKAQKKLFNDLQLAIKAQGCACGVMLNAYPNGWTNQCAPPPENYWYRDFEIAADCNCQIQSSNGFMGIITIPVGGGTFHPAHWYSSNLGRCPKEMGTVTFTPITFNAPGWSFNFAAPV